MADLALLIARVWLGAVMLAHGVNHGRSLAGTTRWFASKGFRSPSVNARLSVIGELAIGTALITGFLTSFAGAGVVAIMFVAFWSIHRFAGIFVFRRPDEGYEYVATLGVLALLLGAIGPGAWSLDRMLGIELTGAAGAGVVAAGVVVGAVQLAVLWRRPESR